MHLCYPEYCKEFHCLAGECPDTCCSGWQVIVDEDSVARYRGLTGGLREKVDSVLEESEGETCFRLCENGDCPFLTAAHLCEFYPLLGNEGLCFPCRTYPRIFEEFGLLREQSLSLSCPAAAQLILGSEAPITFCREENDEPLRGCNEIDADLYRELTVAHTAMIAIAQSRRAMPVAERAALLLLFAQELQEAINSRSYEAMAKITGQYSDPHFLSEKRESLKKYRAHPERRQKNVIRYFELLREMEPMKPKWREQMGHNALLLSDSAGEPALFAAQNNRFEALFQREDYRFEHLLVYYLFRYALRAVDDRDLYSRIKFTVFSLLVIRQMLTAELSEGIPVAPHKMIELSHRYSRELEHSPVNLAALRESIHHEKCFEIRQMLWTLLG